jgi:outer membrane immunogenic protein
MLALALASALGLTSAVANAADIYQAPPVGYKDTPYVPAPLWTGFYLGVNGGYASDAWDRHGNMADNGGFGGGQIGYNWQGVFGWHPNLVLGVEADFQGADISHSQNGFFGNGDALLHKRGLDDFGAVRGRIGYAFGPALAYFTGGFAYGDRQNEFNDLVTGASFKDSGTKTGYVLGGGVEYMFARAWSVKAEYQFIDLDHDNAFDAAGNYVRTKDTELNTFRGGINYHFGNVYEPLK